VVYALGGGQGHAVRGAGVAAALQRRGLEAVLWISPSGRRMAEGLATDVPTNVITSHDERLPTLARQRLNQARAIVVDTFPEGVMEELSATDTTRLALLRYRRDAASIRFRRGLGACTSVLDLEPNLDWLQGVERLAPVARRIIQGADDDGSVCLIDGGDTPLAELYDKLGARLHALGLAVCRRSSTGPPLTFGRAPRVVVGPAGYNLTYELAAAGIHHLAIPRPRPFDDQGLRARAVAETFARPEALEERIVDLCLRPVPRRAPVVRSYDDVAAWVSSQL